jgi:hypothetical protein
MDFASRQYAFEGQLFVIVSSGYIEEDMIPDSFPLKKHTVWDFPGGSGIINPRGDYIAGPVYGKEDILYADIDMDMIIRAKAVIDAAGHFSRPDILQLNIKENSPSSSNGSVDQNSSETIYDLKASIEKIAKRQGELEEKIETLIDKLSDNTEKSS